MLTVARRKLIRTNPFRFPGTAPRFDPAHPASQNPIIATVSIAGNHENILTGKLGTLTGTPAAQIIGNVGSVVACSGTNRSAFAISGGILTPITLACIFFWSGTNAASQDICGNSSAPTGNGTDLSLNSTGVAAFRIGSAQVACTLPALVSGRSYFMAISGSSGANFNVAYSCAGNGSDFLAKRHERQHFRGEWHLYGRQYRGRQPPSERICWPDHVQQYSNVAFATRRNGIRSLVVLVSR
jgi:hypothetical protein